MLDMCGAGDSKHRFAISFIYYITTGKVEGDAVLWKFKNKFPFPFLCPILSQQEEEVCTRGRCISKIKIQDGTPASYHCSSKPDNVKNSSLIVTTWKKEKSEQGIQGRQRGKTNLYTLYT